jgi:HTH-type transcriptional regulator / antitoxin HigA
MNDSTIHEITPDWSLHPGVILGHFLDSRGIRQSELAERTGLSAKHVNQIVKQAVTVTPDVAVLLDRALDTPPRFWGQAAADWDMQSSEAKAEQDLWGHIEWGTDFDTETLVRNQVIAPSDPLAERADKVLRFFGVATPQAFEQTWMRPRISFRRSQRYSVQEKNTALWLRLVERRAESMNVGKYRPAAVRRVAARIPPLTNMQVSAGFVAAQAALAEIGVALVFVRQVPETRVVAATWWLDSERPVIGITERQRKPDIFWFSLVHELGHLDLHARRETFLALEKDQRESALLDDKAEDEADQYAERVLLPGNVRRQIVAATTPQQLILIAAHYQLGVPIVAGQHGHLTNNWRVGGKLRGKITDADIAELETHTPAPPLTQ